MKTQEMEDTGTVQTEQASCWGWCYKELSKTHPEELWWGHRSRPYHACLHSLARLSILHKISLVLSFPWTPISKFAKQGIRWGWYSRRCLNIFSIKVGDDSFTLLCGDSILAKPTPLLVPLISRRIRVEITWPKDFSIPFSSCSSIENGRFEMCKFVGFCSCCFAICACTPLAFSVCTTFCVAEGLSKSTRP